MSTDFITILRCRRGWGAGKRFVDGVEQPFSAGSLFGVGEHPLDRPHDLFPLLEEVQLDRRLCVIRGRTGDEHRHILGDGRLVRKTCHPQKDGYPAVFEPAAHRWIMLDLDGFDLARTGAALLKRVFGPGHAQSGRWSPTVLEDVDRLALELLPPEFRGVVHWAQLTSSAGLKPGGRIRLAFWLDRPVDDGQAKRWLGSSPVDLSLYNPVQIHFTVRPAFTGEPGDPVRGRRSFVDIRHPRNTVTVPDAVVAPPARPRARSRMVTATPAPSGRARRYADACLRGLAGAREGDRHPTAVRVAIRLFSIAQAGELDERWVAGTLKATLRTHGDRFATDTGDREINDILTWAWQHAEPWGLDQ